MSRAFKTIEREIAKGGLAPVYLVIGDEDWSIRKFLALLKKMLVDPSMADFNFDQIGADERSAIAVIDQAKMMPMMADRRLIVVENCERWKKKDHLALVKYFAEANDACVLVLLFESADLRLKLFKSKWAAVRRLEFPRPKRWEIPEYLRELAVDMGLKLTPDALELTAEMVGDDLGKAHQELEKLSLFKLGSNEIGLDDVARLMGRTRHVTRWELNDFIGKRDFNGTLVKLHDILDSGEEPIGLLAAVNLFLKQLLTVKALAVKGVRDRNTVGQALRVPPRIAETLLQQQKSYSGYELRRAFQLMRETDIRLKSSGMDRRLLLDHLITQILITGPYSPPRPSLRK